MSKNENKTAYEVENGQTNISADKNAKFFLDVYQDYRAKVDSIDTYSSISLALSDELKGMDRLLDIGNGGVFNYDTTCIKQIVAMNLFLDDLPKYIQIPKNVEMVQGSCHDIPKSLHGFDGVCMVMLIHHLVGKTVSDCLANINQTLLEARRVLRPRGKLVIIESCVPNWFFAWERILFKTTSFVIEKTMKHPPTLQYPQQVLKNAIEQSGFVDATSKRIPLGKYVLQFGIKVPSWITVVQPVLFSAVRP